MRIAHEEQLPIPTKPLLRPIQDVQIEAFALELEHMCLEEEPEQTPVLHFKNSEETNHEEQHLYECQQNVNQKAPKRRHRDIRDSTIHRRSMLAKLDNLDRAPTKRRHFL